ncbi:peptidoglycan-binding protein [Lyngbya aestuarii]|uniref:peptidoglycan-binding protein n=1 Tax=Lyngbya aestuarii TaxID=118322 RepID=UPI00403E27D8
MINSLHTLILATFIACLSLAVGKNHNSQPEPVLAYSSVDSSSLKLAQTPPVKTNQPTIGPGSRGEKVKELQEKLKELSYYQGEVDGVYGQGSRTAIREFQKSAGLTADGIAGSTTWELIETALAKQNQPTPPEEQEQKKDADQSTISLDIPKKPLLILSSAVLIYIVMLGGAAFFWSKALDFTKTESEEDG